MRDFSSADRLTQNQNPALGTQQLTPTQSLFRTTLAQGKWALSDPSVETNHTAYNMKFYEDGTVDLIRLEAGDDGWQDLGGKGAYDVRAGRI